MTERNRGSRYGESPLVVLSLIVSMSSVLIGGIGWLIGYHSELVDKTELKQSLKVHRESFEKDLNNLTKRFEGLRVNLRLSVLNDVIHSKVMELDMLQQLNADSLVDETAHRRRLLELENDLGTLRVEQRILMEDSGDESRSLFHDDKEH